ncbi:PAS domain-containing protein [Cellulomonas pakistanensis]|uniref:PAS fold-3 domain-containing protein n=1 Tax=Cellulomonas pakistanensis TaxID=992287 RepID=A0A919PBY2_9CELL|nr:PAS domain-containing protein [Cellulomonas pakistanensis]GIG36873.1 hypothetical protein Cpa01nite_22540 [Cellulomonas pakistanensis]
MRDHPAPTGELRTLGPTELIFSTTDARGVITAANGAFCRIAAHEQRDLLGAPHNVIRHPDMPGGAFRAMWDTLQSGRPFAAYVQNLAGDGVAYWVYATVTPLGDGYLSVRITPGVESTWSAAAGAYGEMLEVERAARNAGHGSVEAAAAGRDHMVRRLGELGFANHDEFMHTVMPAEVLALVERRRWAADRGAVGGPAGDVLAACLAVTTALEDLLRRLDGLQHLAERLQAVEQDALGAVAALTEVTAMASQASATVSDTAPVLVSTAGAMSTLGDEVGAMMTALAPALAAARRSVLRVRFLIALARLHTDMVGDVAREVGRGEPEVRPEHLAQLSATLRDDLTAATVELAAAAGVLRGVGGDLESAHDRLRRTDRFLATWRVQVPRYQVSRQLAPYVSPIDGRLRMSHEQLAAMRDLAQECEREARPFDDTALRGLVGRIARAADELATPWASGGAR